MRRRSNGGTAPTGRKIEVAAGWNVGFACPSENGHRVLPTLVLRHVAVSLRYRNRIEPVFPRSSLQKLTNSRSVWRMAKPSGAQESSEPRSWPEAHRLLQPVGSAWGLSWRFSRPCQCGLASQGMGFSQNYRRRRRKGALGRAIHPLSLRQTLDAVQCVIA